ncbi:MAG: adenylate/guanylate cyclase domain-containing protein [Bacteroidota bacterium]
MFQTFRKRLLFWFLIFISFSLIIIALSVAYIQLRESILTTNNLIEASYVALLNVEVAQKDFLSYDTKNRAFFEGGQSVYLEKDINLTDSTFALLQAAKQSTNRRTQPLRRDMEKLEIKLGEIDSIFLLIVEKVNQRGFKDYMLEGEMRAAAHWLEQAPEIPTEKVLILRRHEKDYVIRNEYKYVDLFNFRVGELRGEVVANRRMGESRQQEILSYLDRYQQKFNQIVGLDREIGLKNNTALKLELDHRIRGIELGFDRLVKKAITQKERTFFRLNAIFIALAVLLPLISIWISYVMANRITQPLTDLTLYITRFVDSNFTLKEDQPKVRSKDEIGKLTQNFSILKDEITSQLQFFKEKVEERTQALATANQKLRTVNESNSRFVPMEFIHFLGKNSIEEVCLGDHIEQEMTIMFTDIRQFTKLSERLTPEENFDFINEYLDHIVPAIQRNDGIIDKFIGDCIMALFPGGPAQGLQASVELHQALQAFNAKLNKQGQPPIRVGTGLHTGQMILGTIGTDERLQTTVISDAVNIASRVEGLTKFYKANIIITEESITKLPAANTFHYRFLDIVKVKGKTKAISIFELLSPHDPKLRYQAEYDAAVRLMRNKQIAEAAVLFDQLHRQNPEDEAIEVILARCQEYLQNGLPKGWDGVEEMEEK